MIFKCVGLSFIVPALMYHISRASATTQAYSTQTLYEKFGTDSVLKGYVIERSTVNTLVECCLKCAALLPQCKSLNYVKNLNEKAICEINNSSKILTKKEDFVGQPRSQYFEAITVTNKNQAVNQDVCENQNANGLCSSLILKGKDDYIKQLLLWLNNTEWSLLYRASQNGWEANDFHSRCDNKGPTVTIIEVGQYIFGGYTDASWAGTGGYKESTESFLFSLRNKDNLEPFKSSVYRSSSANIFQHASYGPTFGSGHDIYIKSEANTQIGSYTNFGHTYELPPGYVVGHENTKALLAGSYNKFLLTELEVLYLGN